MKIKGSFTIEASIIFPIVSFILIITIFISIYMYEKATLQSISNLAIIEARKAYTDTNYRVRLKDGLYIEKNKDEKAKEISYDFIEKNIRSKNLKINISINSWGTTKNIRIYISDYFTFPFAYPFKTTILEISSQGSLLGATDYINTLDLINDISDNIKPLRVYKDRYNDILKKIEDTINDWI